MNRTFNLTRSNALLAISARAWLSTCAGTPPRNEQMAVGKAAVDRAAGPASAEAPAELASAPDYNAKSSLRRADAVNNALVGMGVATQRMSTVGYGEESPVAANSTDTNRALNRRVEVTLGDNDQPVRSRR